ncbi:superoxide dismutase, Fe-Mn family [Evansella caseinilytica]|uniref:superoxide dismutase n=1 Tax=Evansella caseinilytica TaxID=1503961 RepID=A0A1H3L983_9BACI|nr:superoxide dismutase [Evansella caseinilytica]SDY60445.1 superoxide dismutase, Fe-Mn family [Evansella caseinilytica]
MSSDYQYREAMLDWLEQFAQEIRGIDANYPEKDSILEGAEALNARLHERGAFDPEYFYQAEKDAEELYSRYLQVTQRANENERNRQQSSLKSVPVGGHKLPRLPYSYDALEPHIQRRIMELHHQKHHQSYVDGLNKAEKELETQRRKGKFENIKHWERELAFHGAGHYLHTLFWQAMSPDGGGKPKGRLAEQMTRDFGGFDAFKAQFSEAADKVEGGGWAILVWASRSGRLEILTAEKHQNLSQWDVIPLLPLDVWEHAYYLQYENDRREYINNWWNVVHWPHVEERFQTATAVLWSPLV